MNAYDMIKYNVVCYDIMKYGVIQYNIIIKSSTSMVQSIQHDWQPINQSHGYPKSWPSSRRSKQPQARAGSPGLTASPNFESDLLIFKKHFYIYASRFTYAHVGKYIWSLAIIAFWKWHRLTSGNNYSFDVVSRLNMRYEEREVSRKCTWG